MTTKEIKTEKLKRAKAELEAVDAAIIQVLSAQQYSMGSRSVSKVSYAALMKRKAELEDTIDALQGGAGRFRRVIPVDQ